MKSRTLVLTAALAAALASGPSHAALEAMGYYDTFDTSSVIDGAHWQQGERRRVKKAGVLSLLQRDVGPTNGTTGVVSTNFPTSFTDGSRITQMKATLTPLAATVTTCAENPSDSTVQTGLIGSFFNTGTQTAGQQTGDVLAQVYLLRRASAPTAPLEVAGGIGVCTNTDCSSYSTIATFNGLGTVNVGQAVTLALQFDRAAKTFTAIRDGAVTSVLSYAVSDRNQPGIQFKQLRTRTSLANCPASNRATGLIEVNFDDVGVNRTAAP